MDAFYIQESEGQFRGTISTRGPWSNELQHGGPPSALLARAFERLLAPGFCVTRLTVEFFRPVPVGTVTLEAAPVRSGKSVTWLQGTLSAGGKEVCRASGVAMRTARVAVDLPEPPPTVPGPEASRPFAFPFFQAAEGYHTAMEVRLARGAWGAGALAAWMRMRVPLLAGELPSPLQRTACAADSGGGVSKVLDIDRFTFMNADLSIHLHRAPEGEWICLDARTIAHAHGIGVAESELCDTRGPVGRAVQGLLIDAR